MIEALLPWVLLTPPISAAVLLSSSTGEGDVLPLAEIIASPLPEGEGQGEGTPS